MAVRSGERVAGRTRWGVFALIVLLPALLLIPLLVVFVGLLFSESDDRPLGGAAREVPCANVLRFGGAALPPGAQPAGICTREGWQDLHYRAEFRMPRADVRDWLARAYPDAPAPETEFCADEDADLCLVLGDAEGLPEGVAADTVQVSVVHEDAGTARVRFTAFTM